MALDAANVRVGITGGVRSAAVGTTAPAGANLTSSEKAALDKAVPRRRQLSMPMRTY